MITEKMKGVSEGVIGAMEDKFAKSAKIQSFFNSYFK